MHRGYPTNRCARTRSILLYCSNSFSLLLSTGSHIDDTDPITGYSLIHYAIQSGAKGMGLDDSAAQCVAALIRKGADVNLAATHTQITPLMLASALGMPETVQVLLKSTPSKGAVQLNTVSRAWGGYTALHFAVAQSHVAVVEGLVKGLASPVVRDASGRTPLDLAIVLRDQQPQMYGHRA